MNLLIAIFSLLIVTTAAAATSTLAHSMAQRRATWLRRHPTVVPDSPRVRAQNFAALRSERYEGWERDQSAPPPLTAPASPRLLSLVPPVDAERQTWNYHRVLPVASAIELLAQQIYDRADKQLPDTQRAYQFRTMLGRLVTAAAGYSESLQQHRRWSDSLYDLFYLDQAITALEDTCAGFPNDKALFQDLKSVRALVQRLLWNYRVVLKGSTSLERE